MHAVGDECRPQMRSGRTVATCVNHVQAVFLRHAATPGSPGTWYSRFWCLMGGGKPAMANPGCCSGGTVLCSSPCLS